MEAVIALAPSPGGFTAAQHAEKVREIMDTTYSARQSSYDLKKLRGKELVKKISSRGRYYEPTPDGLRAMAALVVLRDKVIKPLLTYNGRCKPGSKTAATADLDARYQAVQREMQQLFRHLQLAA
jgi:DNA-binding transcriptional ArsR family regulator